MGRKGIYSKVICGIILTPLILSSCADNNSARVRKKGHYYYGEDGVSKYIVVQPGETLMQIATNHNVSLQDLASINKISPPYHIYAGQHMKLPTERYHTVRSGETLFGIASKYSVPFESLALANNLNTPYTIKIGHKLRIPDSSEYVEEAIIADPYQQVVEENTSPILPPSSIEEESIVAKTKETPPPSNSDAYEDVFQNLENQLTSNVSPAPSKPPMLYKTAHPLGKREFTWPIQQDASVIHHYGEHKGKFSEGISIAAPLNAPIAATSKGEVLYVGNDVEGYGKMVIIKHDNDILSAYAHNSSVLVKKGEKVSQGQIIAKVGKTGEVDKPQLYFSLRKGKTTINPE